MFTATPSTVCSTAERTGAEWEANRPAVSLNRPSRSRAAATSWIPPGWGSTPDPGPTVQLHRPGHPEVDQLGHVDRGVVVDQLPLGLVGQPVDQLGPPRPTRPPGPPRGRPPRSGSAAAPARRRDPARPRPAPPGSPDRRGRAWWPAGPGSGVREPAAPPGRRPPRRGRWPARRRGRSVPRPRRGRWPAPGTLPMSCSRAVNSKMSGRSTRVRCRCASTTVCTECRSTV